MATPNYTIDPQKQTVSGQLSGLLQQDNPYIQQARTQGQQYANKRGLINSTMGAEASQDAAIKSALPIAQADATINNQFAGQKYGAELQENLNEQQNAFAASQNQAKFDQDWRMQQAEGATQREVEALKQQSLMFAQFTKGVADINAADMTGSEKSAAVSALWTQFQKGSDIANTLRDITINEDGSVTRNSTTSISGAADGSDVFTNNYVSGTTTDPSGNLIDMNGYPKPSSKEPTTTAEGYDFKLVNGVWEKYTIPKLPAPTPTWEPG